VASISSVITGGFGVPGSASLVITDGFGSGATAPVTSLSGRRRRGRRPLWLTDAEGVEKIQPDVLAVEREYIATLASIHDLVEEQKILREAVGIATARQRKTISSMMKTIERRMDEIEEDEAVIVLLT
jgi:hypothetical protein